MKISYKHLVRCIEEKPSIEEISDKLFQLGHEHEITDGVFDLEITPNRGDCLSLNGILRELNIFFKLINNNNIYTGDIKKFDLDFVNYSKKFCSNISFLKIEIKNNVQKYNNQLKYYFEDLDIPKNNFFTDVSNYVMYETGQPTHCYDSRKINGKISLVEIEDEINFETLLNKKITLKDKNHLFLMNDIPINLAGIMGAKNTACSPETSSILLECAHFLPEKIMGQSLKYGINSDAAHKFERGVDPLCHENVIRRYIQIVQEHAEIVDLKIYSENAHMQNTVCIDFDHNKINKILGTNISEEDYIKYLDALQFSIKDGFINIPSHRNDLETQNDLAEEIARIIGYNNIPVKKIELSPSNTESNSIEKSIKSFLIDNGFFEVINFPFVVNENKNAILIDNPLDATRKFLRTNISQSLTENLLYNERRQKDSIKLFEVSDIYTFEENKIINTKKLSVIASGRVGKNYVDFSKKINIDYLKNLFEKFLPNIKIKFENISRESLDSKSKSEIVYFEININELPEEICNYQQNYTPPSSARKYQPISDYPCSIRDVSYLIRDSSKIDLLHELIFNYKNSILRDVFIFDYYLNEKNNEVKIGFRFTFQSNNETLTIEQIDDVLNHIIAETLEIDSIEIPGLSK